MKDMYSIIVKPLLSEKGVFHAQKMRRYPFEVAMTATKIDIRRAVENIYSVKVESVHTQIIPGRAKRMRMQKGMTPSWKKAIVKLAEGYNIELM